jgi:unsaturated chondroitin disaccharide hydrolase
MKKILFLIPLAILLSCASNKGVKQCTKGSKTCAKQCKAAKENDYSFISRAFSRADSLYREGLKSNNDLNQIPRSIENDGSLITVKPGDWTCGFYPGTMWYLYEYQKSDFWLKEAQKWTENLEEVKNKKTTHDVGFMIYCSFGNGYRLTKNPNYLDVINTASNTLITRFNPVVGCTKSWNKYKFSEKWQFPVIIDNMMNLEMLFFSSKMTGSNKYSEIATSHANTTLKNHFREDYSSYHVVDYDSLTGKVIQKNTHQGLADNSSWARGQTWGLYGFTYCYRETKDTQFLAQAKKIANYIMTYPTIPADKIPLWDYVDPAVNAPRDASAAALTASALLDLQQYVDEDLKKSYISYATDILRTLSSDKYLNKVGQNHNFILLHGTGNYPKGSEIDLPLNYGDYYYLEALHKLNKLITK